MAASSAHTPDDAALRDQARGAILSGKLPSRNPDRTLGGPGSQQDCAVCGERVQRHQMELEIEFKQHGPSWVPIRYHFHPRCFAVWEIERTKH